VPLYPVGPEDTAEYEGLSEDAHRFAQSFLCVSLNMSEISALAELMLLNAPDVYGFNVTNMTATTYPSIGNLSTGHFNHAATCDYREIHGMTVFAKSGEWNNGLWESCVTPTFQTSLCVFDVFRHLTPCSVLRRGSVNNHYLFFE
jgi:hypothetical protein